MPQAFLCFDHKLLKSNFLFILTLVIWIIFFYVTPVKADLIHALAMHGTPRYEKGFQHFDYTNPNALKGGDLRLGKVGTFNNLNKLVIIGNTPDEGLEYLNDPLMQRAWNEPFTLYGLVAESIEVPKDRSWIVFHLNKQARFHDEMPITTADVKFSFEAYLKYGHPVRRRVYDLVKNIEVRTPYEIKFSFDKGYDRESVMILAMMPVLPKHYWEERDISKTTLESPLGSGPYKIRSVDPGRSLVLERVQDYWGRDLPVNKGLYNFNTITYTYYRDDAVALQAFLAGHDNLRREYDIKKWNTAYPIEFEKAVRFKKEEIVHQRPEWLRALIFNRRRPLFQERRVRQALSLMVNYVWLNKAFYFNSLKPIASTFPNSSLAAIGIAQGAERDLLLTHKADLPSEVFDMAWRPSLLDMRENERRAMSLLKEAGYLYEDQKLLDPEGIPVQFEILVGELNDEKVALEFARALKKIGITARVRQAETAQFQSRLRNFDYDMVAFKWLNSLSPGNEQLNYWGSAAADLKGSRNYAGIKNKAIDALAASVAAAPDYASLVVHAHALDRALMWGAYFVPLLYSGKDRVVSAFDLSHPEVFPVYGNVIEAWWQEPSLQKP